MIRHILKDGTEVPDITGHVVMAKEHVVLYEVINSIQKKERKKDEAISTPD